MTIGGVIKWLIRADEEMHSDTDKALFLAGVTGYLFGTIRPEGPWEHSAVKIALASIALVATFRVHPGAEKIARDWQRYQESDGRPKSEAEAGEEWQCPECDHWNYVYHVEGDMAFCSSCSEGVPKDADVETRPRVHR